MNGNTIKQPEPKLHHHPRSRIPVYGIRLVYGTVLMRHDVFPHVEGTWTFKPPGKMRVGEKEIWIRPV